MGTPYLQSTARAFSDFWTMLVQFECSMLRQPAGPQNPSVVRYIIPNSRGAIGENFAMSRAEDEERTPSDWVAEHAKVSIDRTQAREAMNAFGRVIPFQRTNSGRHLEAAAILCNQVYGNQEPGAPHYLDRPIPPQAVQMHAGVPPERAKELCWARTMRAYNEVLKGAHSEDQEHRTMLRTPSWHSNHVELEELRRKVDELLHQMEDVKQVSEQSRIKNQILGLIGGPLASLVFDGLMAAHKNKKRMTSKLKMR